MNQDDISFELSFKNDLETLFTSDGRQKDFDGALYVPELAPNSSCIAETENLIPRNVTHLQDLPESSCGHIALAPWVSPSCAQQFLAAARNDDAIAAVVYMPTNNATRKLPPADSDAWALDDGGAWESEEPFPVYAIPGGAGEDLTRSLALYSGSLFDAPHSDELARHYDDNSQVRVFATVHLGTAFPSIC